MSDNQSNNKRIAKNTLYLYIRMFVVMLVTLYTSRVILEALGVEDYGIYNVVAGFVSMFGFLNATLSASMQRFYNYEGTKNGTDGFRDVFNSGIRIHLFIAIILLLLLETIGLWYTNCIMVVPDGRLSAVNWVFQFSTASLIFMLVQIPYAGAILAKEKMNYFALVSIIDVVLKLLVAYCICINGADRLCLYSLGLLCISILNIFLYVAYCKFKFKELEIKKIYRSDLYRPMLSFSGWNLVGTFAFMLKGQGLNLVLNLFFGPIVNAARGIASQVNGAVSSFTASVFTAFRPQLVNSYAEGKYNRTRKLLFLESKICFVLIAILITPLILEMASILHFWLGDNVPDQSIIFSDLVLIDSLVCTFNTPCTQVIMATGKIKKYQIGSSVVNLLLIPVCWVFLKIGFSAETAFVITIIFSIINQIVCLYYTNKEFKVDILEYLKDVVCRSALFVILMPIVPFFICKIVENSIISIIVVSVATFISTIPLLYWVVMNKEERDLAYSFVHSKLKIKK